jgi:hypothetical protein
MRQTRGRHNLTSIPLKKPDELNTRTMNTPFVFGLRVRQKVKATVIDISQQQNQICLNGLSAILSIDFNFFYFGKYVCFDKKPSPAELIPSPDFSSLSFSEAALQCHSEASAEESCSFISLNLLDSSLRSE